MRFVPAGAAAYLAPYGAFLLLVELLAHFPQAAAVLFPLRVAVPAVLLGWFWQRGAFKELRGYRAGAGTLADVAAGLAIAALWIAPYVLLPSLPRGRPFDPGLLGGGNHDLALALRLVGFALVTPLHEELFVRSFVLRFAEVFDRGDFREVPVARFAWRGFVASVLWFTFSHARWEWWVALPTGIALNAWLYRRGHLGACVLAHAVANATIWAVVVLGPTPLWEFL